MGFLSPSEPPLPIEDWKRLSQLQRIKPLAQDWGVNGFGTPYGVYLLYLVKCAIYALGGLWLISTTSGLGGLSSIGDWWTEPIVFQKAIVWTMLWEALGLGAGSLPLTFRFLPPFGGFLHWLRPGTIRLPPWPDRVPLTAGNTRTPFDVALYAGFVSTGLYLLIADGEAVAGTAAGRLDPTAIVIMLAFLVVLGLRDKVPYLAARSEQYATLLVVFLFPIENLLVASQLVFVAIWLGAASSKLNSHFPFVVSVMTANTPWNRSKWMKRKLWRDYPDDMRPSRLSALMAHAGTAIELGVPLVLLFTAGGTVGAIAVVIMVIFHLHIFSTFPLAVPLEWNLLMIFGLLFLFGENGEAPLSSLDNPLLIAFLLASLLALPIYGSLRPDRVSFLTSMRYYAGNWATSQWLFRRGGAAEDKLDTHITKAARTVVHQVGEIYDPDMAELLMGKGIAFRAMHTHGRAIAGLVSRAVEDPDAYDIREGELISGIINGYNFGDGHFHSEQLLAAVQERCHFEPGELRVIMLESEPLLKGTQHYRIHDAATGLIEEGLVRVADMVERQPWLDGGGVIPVEVIGGPGLAPAAGPPGR